MVHISVERSVCLQIVTACYRAINSTRSCLDLNLEFCEVPFTFNVASAVTIDSLETAICSGESPLRRPT